MTDTKLAALAALIAAAPLAIGCQPTSERLYEADPWAAEETRPFPGAPDEAAAEPQVEESAPPLEQAPTERRWVEEGVPSPLLRGAIDGSFGPIGTVADEANVSLASWFGSDRVILEVVTDLESATRAIVAVGMPELLFAMEPTDGPVPLPALASVWICSEGQDEDGADWSWDQPSTEGTVEILALSPDVYEYRFDVQGRSDGDRFGRATARASFVRALTDPYSSP